MDRSQITEASAIKVDKLIRDHFSVVSLTVGYREEYSIIEKYSKLCKICKHIIEVMVYGKDLMQFNYDYLYRETVFSHTGCFHV